MTDHKECPTTEAPVDNTAVGTKPKPWVKTKGECSNGVIYLLLQIIYIQRKRPLDWILRCQSRQSTHGLIPKVSFHAVIHTANKFDIYPDQPPTTLELTAVPSTNAVDKRATAHSAHPGMAPRGVPLTTII